MEKCLREIQSAEVSFRDYVLNNGLVNEDKFLPVVSKVFNLPYVDLKTFKIDPTVLEKVPVRFAWYFKFMPVKLEGNTVSLAVAHPLEVKYQDEIRVHLGLVPQFVLAKEADVLAALNQYYGLAADKIDRLVKETGRQTNADADFSPAVEDLEQNIDEVSVSKLVNQILFDAYKKRATDIHIEPYRSKVRVRYRIDGVLIDANVPAAVRQFLPSIISRIKIMANLSIVEKRIPQDGSAVVKTKEQDLDLRISTIPTPHGESMVIRILPTKVMFLSLERLGLGEGNLRAFRALVNKPHGIVLVTGPTGSGKTTTLYACLNEINSPDHKIITLEDPIEFELEGITQIQLNPKVNMDFARGLRSVLRHDPDIIMVGEVRDLETAEIAIRTALTGHLVFSTLHTNDAASGITRLVEMGVEPFLVASSVEAFIAQRLVRVICPKCKEEIKTPLLEIREEIAAALKISDPQEIKIFQGRGCDYCNQTGFYGRTAIYEILTVDENIRKMVIEKQRADVIKRVARKNGMTTLRQDGWKKVLDGITTPAEVMEVAERDEALTGEPLGGRPVAVAAAAAVREVPPDILSTKDEYNSRVYPRLSEKLGIRYSVLQPDPSGIGKFIADGIEHASVTKDISAGGVRFISGYTLPVGTILSVKIQLGKSDRRIDCLAKICRVEDDSLSAMYNLVAYYLDLSSADRVRINDFVQAQIAKETAKEKKV